MSAGDELDQVDRALLDERTRALARAPDEAPTTRTLEVVVLQTAGESYALPARAVEAVAELTHLTPIPHAPAVVAGLTAFRGEVLPVFFLRPVLGLGLSALPERGRLILVTDRDGRVALAVDAVLGPLWIAPDDLCPPVMPRGTTTRALVLGVAPTGVALLDVEALLADERLLVDIPLMKMEDSMTTTRARR